MKRHGGPEPPGQSAPKRPNVDSSKLLFAEAAALEGDAGFIPPSRLPPDAKAALAWMAATSPQEARPA